MAELIPMAPGPHENWTNWPTPCATVGLRRRSKTMPHAFYVPLVEGTFTTMFRCATRADLKIRYSAMRAPKILDLGSGWRPWAIAMLNGCPDGTAVINDSAGRDRRCCGEDR